MKVRRLIDFSLLAMVFTFGAAIAVLRFAFTNDINSCWAAIGMTAFAVLFNWLEAWSCAS